MPRKRNPLPTPPPANGGYEFEVVELGPPAYPAPVPPAKSRGRPVPAGDGEGLPPRPAPGAARKSRPKVPLVPTEEEIGRLPLWARVAWAARCARRVQPAYREFWAGTSERTLRVLDRAVRTAEQAAAAATRLADADALAATLAAAAHPAPGHAFPAAAAAAGAAASAAVVGAPYAARSVADAARHAVHLILSTAAVDTPLAAQLRCLRRDFARLRRLAREQNWTDDTPVPPDVFGPLWPPGVEPHWAVEPPAPPAAG
jgi:hypothetical protein